MHQPDRLVSPSHCNESLRQKCCKHTLHPATKQTRTSRGYCYRPLWCPNLRIQIRRYACSYRIISSGHKRINEANRSAYLAMDPLFSSEGRLVRRSEQWCRGLLTRPVREERICRVQAPAPVFSIECRLVVRLIRRDAHRECSREVQAAKPLRKQTCESRLVLTESYQKPLQLQCQVLSVCS